MNDKMKIEEHKIPVREVIDGYVDSAELGVRGYHGKLNIRPAYQREFVYKPAQRDAVIETVRQGFPLNVMYNTRIHTSECFDSGKILSVYAQSHADCGTMFDMCRKNYRIVIALRLSTQAGQRTLQGIYRFLTETGTHWDVRIKRDSDEFGVENVARYPKWGIDGIIFGMCAPDDRLDGSIAEIASQKVPIVAVDVRDQPAVLRTARLRCRRPDRNGADTGGVHCAAGRRVPRGAARPAR